MSGCIFLLHQFKVWPRASLEEHKSKAEMFTREDGANISTLFITTLSLDYAFHTSPGSIDDAVSLTLCVCDEWKLSEFQNVLSCVAAATKRR